MEKKLFEKEVESHRQIGGLDTFSQAHQDLFVMYMTSFMREGTYLEVGGAEPKQSNNTYLLEKYYGWSGWSLEIDEKLCREFNKQRRNPCIQADATVFDFEGLLRERVSAERVNYLSLDIDPSSVTLVALKNLLGISFRFDVITFEHDFYASGPQVMEESRELLSSHGYQRVVSNVMCRGRDFEDWYVDPSVVGTEIWSPFVATKIECADIFRRQSHDAAAEGSHA